MAANKQAVTRALAVRKLSYARLTAPPPRSFLAISELTGGEFQHLIDQGLAIKGQPARFSGALAQKQIALVFQKTSTRTRVSFETGINALGGAPLFIDWKTSNFTLSALSDEIRVLSRYVSMIMARVFAHEDLELMAQHSEVPVINGLSDFSHPCQGLADFMTMQEYFGTLKGLQVAYIGDGNNVAHSLLEAAHKAGASMRLCCPRRYTPSAKLMQKLVREGLDVELVDRPQDAVKSADVIYTDTWVSMGEEQIAETKVREFAGLQVNAALVSKAPKHAVVMHCLPAHRGMEISDDVLDSERSIVVDQAENRRYVQQALMIWLFEQLKAGGQKPSRATRRATR
jgi:ornithine carbamoyltransferase